MDIREYTSPTLPVAQFVERYVDTDHYDAGCRGCDNYGQVWVCPPYDFSVSGYWSGFREVCLRGVQLRFSPEEQAQLALMLQVPGEEEIVSTALQIARRLQVARDEGRRRAAAIDPSLATSTPARPLHGANSAKSDI
jgi:hypothetical protein